MRGGNWNLETSGHRLPQRHWQHSLTPYRWLRGSQTGEERNKKKKYTVFYLPSYSENSPNQPAIFQRQNTDIQQLTGSRMIQLPLQGCPMTKFHSPFFLTDFSPTNPFQVRQAQNKVQRQVSWNMPGSCFSARIQRRKNMKIRQNIFWRKLCCGGFGGMVSMLSFT